MLRRTAGAHSNPVRGQLLAAAIAVSIAAAGCAQHTADPQALADDTTRGVYDVDLARATEHFDDALKTQVNRASVGLLSDRMHALGTYRGLKQVAAEPDKGRYDYQATFDKGTLLVQIRIDPDQKLGAYRIVPTPASG
jgi:hypothetical protein